RLNRSVLTVACEQTEVLLFDPISSKHIKTLSEAHEDCVNNIRFLDNRLFATCSDDTTIALWDLRKLNTKVCTLHGHTSWVKNIEYDTNTRLLVTSGFDGNVIIWDTNRCTEDGCPHKKFFHTRFLMRMRLTPDCSKMLISTSSGAPVRPVSPRCSLRLTHCIEEANVGRGYIKELCFSPDGRMISSPHGFGIRLLGFDAHCSELVDCLPREASPLREIRSLYSHNDVVLTTKFSPTHCQIASGCLSGRVSLYQPKF
uniref:DDB1- and CUL4-associated factor 10 n=1 Tax=Malurus cyaneus samueli TaxID=2593467 RepID=A0A8C5TTS7_9PASS